VIAMSSAFNPFPSGALFAGPPRKTVEYGTGIVVSDDGAIVTDRLITDGCIAIAIPATATPTVSQKTRTTILRCCGSTARAD